MESDKNFQINPFPLEKEFRLRALKPKIKELNREELEEFLLEALSTMSKLAHQVTQLKDYVKRMEGKK